MENENSDTESKEEKTTKQTPLINGVPDDILNLCIAKVPRENHTAMKCVSRRWREFISSDEFSDYRIKLNLSESWIYTLCREKSTGVNFLCVLNPSKRSWKRINVEIPSRIRTREGMGFVVLGKRLFVFGGCGWLEDATDEAYCYDASMNTWFEVESPLSSKRCYFACETLNGKIIAVGGLGLNQNVSQTWDMYDHSTKTYKSYSDESIVSEIEDSFVMDGKIYIRNGSSSVAVYNGIWKRLSDDDEMAFGWRGPAVVVADDLYVLDLSFGATLTMWCKEMRIWVRLGKISQLVMKQPCKVVAIGNCIFVIGKDCSTLVIDVENVRKKKMANGVMVCSSIPKSWVDDDIDFIACKAVSI